MTVVATATHPAFGAAFGLNAGLASQRAGNDAIGKFDGWERTLFNGGVGLVLAGVVYGAGRAFDNEWVQNWGIWSAGGTAVTTAGTLALNTLQDDTPELPRHNA